MGRSGKKWDAGWYHRRSMLLKGELEQMFLGQYQHNLDDKGRLTIPSVFRDALAEGAFITQGLDRNLMVMTVSYFQKVYDRLNSMSITDPSTRMLKRLVLSTAYKMEMDKAGRILVPLSLREFLNVSGVSLVGQGEYFEIWPSNEWEAQALNLQDTESNSQRFAMLDLSTNE